MVAENAPFRSDTKHSRVKTIENTGLDYKNAKNESRKHQK